jgi:hypothetical protein
VRADARTNDLNSIEMNRILHIVAMLAALTAASGSAHADAAGQREDQFKAAYVFNFVKFVAWPGSDASDTLTICFVGGDGVYTALATGIANKRVGTRSLLAVQVTETTPAPRCEAIYIEASRAASYALPVERAVLTISDAANFTARGGMIGLFTENHRLRFVINVGNAHQVGLHISSDLLKLAADVQRGPR